MSDAHDRAYWEEKIPKKGVRAIYEARRGGLPADFPYLDISNGKTTVAHELAKKGRLDTVDDEVLKLLSYEDWSETAVAGYVLTSGGSLPESFTGYNLSMLADVNDILEGAKGGYAGSDRGSFPIAFYIAGPRCDQSAFDKMCSKFHQWDLSWMVGACERKTIIDVALGSGKDISGIPIDYTRKSSGDSQYKFMFHAFPKEMINLAKIEKENLYEVRDDDGFTVAGDLARMGLIPVTSKYMRIKEGELESPVLFRYIYSKNFEMSADVDLYACNKNGTTTAHLLASARLLPADIGIDVLRCTDKDGFTVAHNMMENGVKPINMDRDLWTRTVSVSSIGTNVTLAHIAISNGVFPDTSEVDYSLTDDQGESLALSLVNMGRLGDARGRINSIISQFSDKEWFSTSYRDATISQDSDQTSGSTCQRIADNIFIRDEWKGSHELKSAVFSGLNIPSSTPLDTHIAHGSTLAHAHAYLGTLPEHFDQWDIVDYAGRTVAQIAISGEYPLNNNMEPRRPYELRQRSIRSEVGASSIVREYCLKRCAPIPDSILDSDVVGNIYGHNRRQNSTSNTLRDLAVRCGVDVTEACDMMQM